VYGSLETQRWTVELGLDRSSVIPDDFGNCHFFMEILFEFTKLRERSDELEALKAEYLADEKTLVLEFDDLQSDFYAIELKPALDAVWRLSDDRLLHEPSVQGVLAEHFLFYVDDTASRVSSDSREKEVHALSVIHEELSETFSGAEFSETTAQSAAERKQMELKGAASATRPIHELFREGLNARHAELKRLTDSFMANANFEVLTKALKNTNSRAGPDTDLTSFRDSAAALLGMLKLMQEAVPVDLQSEFADALTGARGVLEGAEGFLDYAVSDEGADEGGWDSAWSELLEVPLEKVVELYPREL